MKKMLLVPEYGLYEKDGKPFCDSLQIAEVFEKRHDHILRDIGVALDTFQNINQPKFGEINFVETSYKDTRNRLQPKFLLSKDGFTYLTMGFDGEKAAVYKIAYINRFNQMEAWIKSLLSAKMDFPAFTEAVMLAYEEPKHYHYSNEVNMIYRIVLGMDAKKFRKTHGLQDREGIRKHLNLEQLKAIETLQRIDIGLLEAGFGYEERKIKLLGSHDRRLRLAG